MDMHLLSGLPPQQTKAILDKVTPLSFRRGQFIFYTDDPADCIFLLNAGMVKVTYGNLRGDEKIVNIFQNGDIFGELFLGKYRYRIGSAIALNDVKVGRLYEDDLLELTQSNPRIGLNLIRYLADSQRETLARIHALMHMDARSRLLGTLLNLTRHYCCTHDDGWFRVPNCISQEDLANLTSLNRSTVNIIINDLRRQEVLGGTGRDLLVNRHAVLNLLQEAGLEILE